jgi:energy-coupling factor transporter ATP-binding protein EcfA2
MARPLRGHYARCAHSASGVVWAVRRQDPPTLIGLAVSDPRVWIGSITFSDGSKFEFHDDDVVVVVGPNNSGKSAALRGVRDLARDENEVNPVVSQMSLERSGSEEDLWGWLERIAVRTDPPSNPGFSTLGATLHKNQVPGVWSNSASLGPITRLFIYLVNADGRLSAANPAPQIRLTSDPPAHPIHHLQRDDKLEARLSERFRRAFGEDLIVHRNAGSEVPIHVGEKPTPGRGEDRASLSYNKAIELLPEIRSQGDGMRSFAGMLLHTSVGPESVILIDEPEAFLHPPQARLLGRMLVQDKPTPRQLFIATHSGDVLRGMLDAGSATVRVFRIERDGATNPVRAIQSKDVTELWQDPLLRHSNILDGLFHEMVVLCESDSDCRFYSAVLTAICDAEGPDFRHPDVMFTHCGGKGRLPVVVRALAQLGVPLRVVADFDVLNDKHPLKAIVEASGLDWALLESDFRLVKDSVDQKKPELESADVDTAIRAVLDDISDGSFPREAKREIKGILDRTSAWSIAKKVGRAFVPSGAATQALNRLLGNLRAGGLFVVEVGELEGFDRASSGHGPKWVNQSIQKDLGGSPDFAAARDFVRAMVLGP